MNRSCQTSLAYARIIGGIWARKSIKDSLIGCQLGAHKFCVVVDQWPNWVITYHA